jgi:tetratricopeptide (TPR) repeat protein
MSRALGLTLRGILFTCWLSSFLFCQQQSNFGKIIGNIRESRGEAPPHRILVSLEMRGTPIQSAYCDDRGQFGFYSLVANEYRVTVNDEAYEPYSETVRVDPSTAPMNFVQMSLVPKAKTPKEQLTDRTPGSNPYLVDPADYYRNFPKKTVKEFEKGVDAEHQGKTDEALQHYEKAISLSPDFYPAHNNLGSALLSRQNFAGAEREFETVLKSNQNDAQAYFNLANVLLLTQRYGEAERQIEGGLQRRPDSAFGYFLQGSLYSKTQRPDLAEKSLLNAVRLDSGMSQAYLQLVNLYLQQKRNADAIGQLETFLKTFPDTPRSAQARALLKRLQDSEAAASK